MAPPLETDSEAFQTTSAHVVKRLLREVLREEFDGLRPRELIREELASALACASSSPAKNGALPTTPKTQASLAGELPKRTDGADVPCGKGSSTVAVADACVDWDLDNENPVCVNAGSPDACAEGGESGILQGGIKSVASVAEAVAENIQKMKLKGTGIHGELGHELTNFQLNRSMLLNRLKLEATMRRKVWNLIFFGMMLLSFLMTLAAYDPAEAVAAVHTVLRQRYAMDELDGNLQTPRAVLEYADIFVKTTYDMASALVDANTLNSIDPVRCFDLGTSDVCRLKYWEVQTRRKVDENYVNLDALFNDKISDKNYQISEMDCRHPHPPDNCMNWSHHVDPNLSAVVMGLTPEDPVILEDRRTFPYAQVVPLAPIVWQTRATKAPCMGFGDKYNQQLLGAGKCRADIRCDPDSESSFMASVPNPTSGRTESIFLAYENDAFKCYNYDEQDTEFYDRSWYPWASRSDLTQGKKIQPKTLLGQTVFYKFISDVNYLKAPVKGTVFFNKSDPCSICEEWSWPDCVDPIEEGEAHPMWEEVSLHAECSARKKWIERFLDDEQTPEKESTFLTPETSSLFFGALVITPQRGGVPDITTLVKMMIERDQHGRFRARPELVSISETPIVTWVTLCSITFVLAVVKAIKCRNHRARSKIFSLIESLAVVVYISVNVYMEFSPPHVIEELTDAFFANDQDAYFKCFTGLLEYSAALEELKLYGFCLIVVLFFRVIAMLDIHPRLGFVHRVAERCADDMMHFFLQFFIVLLVLTFLAFWSFSQRRPEFSTMSWSLYVLFQYFAGDFNWDDTPEDIRFISFLIIYVFVIFVMMVNFLLAIVVNAHSAVMDAVKDNETEQNVIWDLGDLVRCWVMGKRYRWPSPERVRAMVDRNLLEYHEHEHAEGVALPGFPAVTLQELLSDKSVFEHVHGAQAWLHYYAKKMNVLREERKSLRFQRGHCILDETASTSAELSLREG